MLLVWVLRMLDLDVRETFGQNSRKRFDADFRIERMVDRYAELYIDEKKRTNQIGP